MKHAIWATALLLTSAAAAVADVGKDELKKLAQAGLSDDLILSYVRSKGGVARLSAGDLVELKGAGMNDVLLETLIALGTPPPSAETAAEEARAKLLSNPKVVFDGRYYYPRSYFSSDYSAYCSPAIGIGVAYYYPGACPSIGWSYGRSCGRGWMTARAGYGSCGSGGPRVCPR